MVALFVDHLSLIEDLSEEQINLLRPLFKEVQFEAGEVIFSQGEDANYIYFVVEGEVAIRFKPDDGPLLTVSLLEHGDVFGWSAAIGSRAYTSGAVCAKKGTFLRLEGKDLKNLCDKYPDTGILILDRLAGVIAQRLRGTHEQVMALLRNGLNDEREVCDDD
ncbi:MAG: Crp/Fnr family transcriptional regulator [Anaerolineales bacterium]